MSDDLENRLDAVYGAAGDQERLNAIYDAWAQDYERDLWASGNPYIAMIVGYVVRHVPARHARPRSNRPGGLGMSWSAYLSEPTTTV